MLDKLQSGDFRTHLHERFLIHLEGLEPIELELVDVSESGAPFRSDQRKPFSLLFLGPVSGQYLVQSTYRLENSAMGTLDVFIVPVGPREGRMQYQAVFN